MLRYKRSKLCTWMATAEHNHNLVDERMSAHMRGGEPWHSDTPSFLIS